MNITPRDILAQMAPREPAKQPDTNMPPTEEKQAAITADILLAAAFAAISELSQERDEARAERDENGRTIAELMKALAKVQP